MLEWKQTLCSVIWYTRLSGREIIDTANTELLKGFGFIHHFGQKTKKEVDLDKLKSKSCSLSHFTNKLSYVKQSLVVFSKGDKKMFVLLVKFLSSEMFLSCFRLQDWRICLSIWNLSHTFARAPSMLYNVHAINDKLNFYVNRQRI